jgi:outer membrane protein assembly factor BamB
MQVYAFDPFTGTELWETPFMTRGPCRTAVQVGNQTLFQYADEDRLYAINLFDGAERWNMPDGRIVMALMEDKAYVLDANRILHVVDEMTGESLGSISLADYDVHLANTTAPAIFVAKGGGELVCIRLTSAGQLTPEMLEATPRPR